MNRRTLTSSLAAGAAVLGLAGPAHAATLPHPSDPAFAVPAGKVEHTVVVQRVDGANAIPSHTRTESWLGAQRSRTVVTDVRTGRITAETVATPTEIRIYSARDGVIRVERRRRPGGLPQSSAAFEAAVQQAYVEQGIVRVVGEKVVDGRRALVTESVEGRWRSDEPSSVTTAVVDAETFELYERTTTLEGRFRQTQTLSSELLDASAASTQRRMVMRRHRGAKIRRR